MPFASSSDVSDLKDIVYSQHLRILELEEKVDELSKIVTKLDDLITRNRTLGKLK